MHSFFLSDLHFLCDESNLHSSYFRVICSFFFCIETNLHFYWNNHFSIKYFLDSWVKIKTKRKFKRRVKELLIEGNRLGVKTWRGFIHARWNFKLEYIFLHLISIHWSLAKHSEVFSKSLPTYYLHSFTLPVPSAWVHQIVHDLMQAHIMSIFLTSVANDFLKGVDLGASLRIE